MYLDIIAALGGLGSIVAVLFAVYVQRKIVVPKVQYYLHMEGGSNNYKKSYFFLTVTNIGKTTAKDFEMHWRIRDDKDHKETSMEHPFSECTVVHFDSLLPGESLCKSFIDCRINNYTNDSTNLWLEIWIIGASWFKNYHLIKLDISPAIDGGLFVNYNERIAEPPQNYRYLLDDSRRV